MKKENWIWMPHAGHFIMGDQCKFVLNTYVGKYIVSTVGELWSSRKVREIHAEIYNRKWFDTNVHLKGDDFDYEYMKKFGYSEIGCDRKYETMVFEAVKSDTKCCPYRIDVQKEVDFDAYNEDSDATIGHMKLCKKWSNK